MSQPVEMSQTTDVTETAAGAREGILACPSSPRSMRVHDAALQATRELLAEGGLAAATVDAIAARSGVSKATLYKHWPSRTAIAAEAFGGMMAGSHGVLPLPDTGSAVGDITAQVRQANAFYATQPVFAQLLAACVTEPSGAPYFREFFLAGRRAALATLWRRAVERGEVDPAIEAGTATDLLFGPLIFRLMTGHEPLTLDQADKIIAAALNGLLPRRVPNQTHNRKAESP